MAKIDPINPNVPAGSEDPKLGNDRIQQLARAVVEVFEKCFYMGSDTGSGYTEDDAGEIDKIIINAPQTSDPTNEANKGYIYTKDVSGKAELFWEDEDGHVIQLTSAGGINPAIACLLTGNQTLAGVKTFSSQASFSAGLTAAAALISTLATGTAPFTIASTTKVTNLNADKVDGYDVSAYAGGQSYTFPGGLIIKVGSSGINGSQGISFSAAFPNDAIAAFVTHNSSTPYACSFANLSKTGMTLYEAAPGSTSVYWLAIGY